MIGKVYGEVQPKGYTLLFSLCFVVILCFVPSLFWFLGGFGCGRFRAMGKLA